MADKNNDSFCGFAFLALTADDDDNDDDGDDLAANNKGVRHHNHNDNENSQLLEDEDDDDSGDDDSSDENVTPAATSYWLDDLVTQENILDIMTLTPDVAITDSANHICTTIKLFFEELRNFTEEPQPIDPSIDYEAEYRDRMEKHKLLYNRSRRHHIDLSSISSLLEDCHHTPSSCDLAGFSSFIHSQSQHQHDHGYQGYRHPEQQYQYSQQQNHSDIRSPYFLGGGGGGGASSYDHQPYSYGTASVLSQYRQHHHSSRHHRHHSQHQPLH